MEFLSQGSAVDIRLFCQDGSGRCKSNAGNKNGEIFAWESKPQTNSYLWYVYKQERFRLVAFGVPTVIQWKKSLRRYYASSRS